MKEIKRLILVYLSVVIIKIILSYFISSPTGFWDEYIYSKISRNFFYSFDFSIGEGPQPYYPPLYPVMLAISFIFKDMEIIYFLMKIINVLISSLIIIPAYFLSKEFLDKNKSFYVAILVTFLPISFSFSYYIMAENLFNVLFLTSCYFIHKSLSENNTKNNIYAAIFVSLLFLTKYMGLIMIFVYFASHIANRIFYKEKINFKGLLISFFIILILISPWLIRNYLSFGPTIGGVLEGTAQDNIDSFLDREKHKGYYIPSLLNWVIIHTIALSLTSGLIFFFLTMFLFKKIKEKSNLNTFFLFSLILIFTHILILSNNALAPQPEDLPSILQFFTGRPIIRYIDMLTPLILILGTVSFSNYLQESKSILKKLIIASLPFYLVGSQLNLADLFPINNLSLTYLGVIKKLAEFFVSKNITFVNTEFNLYVFLLMTTLFLLLPFSVYILSRLSFKRIFYLFWIFLIMINISNFLVAYYRSEIFASNQNHIAGNWFNENDKKMSNVLFDIRDEGNPFTDSKALFQTVKRKEYEPQHFSLMGFWMNDNLFFDDVTRIENIHYLVSTRDLDHFLIFEIENIKVYRV